MLTQMKMDFKTAVVIPGILVLSMYEFPANVITTKLQVCVIVVPTTHMILRRTTCEGISSV